MSDLRPVVLTILGVVSLAAVAALFAAPAAAQTPDGMPPALETVCDMETGAAFGWCNAYCEAMDCDLANDSDPATEPKASATACSKVRAKFQQATGRDMPCEVSCPCTDNPEAFPYWAAIVAGELTDGACLQDADACYVIDTAIPPELCTPPTGDITVVFTGNQYEFALALASGLGIPDLLPPVCGDIESGLIPLTPAQGALCKAQLDAGLAAAGLVCGFPPPV